MIFNLIENWFISVSVTGMTPSRSFLETEEFETELGGVEPFEDLFNDISAHEIIQVIADGDRVGR